MFVGGNFNQNFTADVAVGIFKNFKYPQLFLFANLSITIRSNQFAGKKYWASEFFKKQRNKERKFLLNKLQSKKQFFFQAFQVYRKNPRK